MDTTPRNSSTETPEIAHSGKLGLEQPEQHFDNTTLPEAFEEHLTDTGGNVIVPNDASTIAPETATPSTSVVETTEAPKTPEATEVPKKRRGLLVAIGAGATAAAAGVALIVGLALPKGGNSGDGHTAPTPDDKATNQPSEAPSQSPEATTKYPEKAYTVEALKIPEALSGEEAVKLLFSDRINEWGNAGKSDKFKTEFDQAMHATKDGEVTYAKEVAAKNTATFADALFIPNWQEKQDLTNIAQDREQSEYATISLWAWTYHPDSADALDYPEDKVPYERGMTVDTMDVVSQSETSIAINAVVILHDNRDENSAAKLTDQPDPNGYKMNVKLEMQKIDGSWKISQMAWSGQ